MISAESNMYSNEMPYRQCVLFNDFSAVMATKAWLAAWLAAAGRRLAAREAESAGSAWPSCSLRSYWPSGSANLMAETSYQ